MVTLLETRSAATTLPPSTITRGFSVPCLKCGETGSVRLSLDDVSVFSCGSCDNEFTADEVRDACQAWLRVLAWLDTAPPVE